MTILFVILIIVASAILGLIVLIQNPKGGGLAGNIAGFSNQFMGVKQTTDVLEKGTWIFAGVIGILCLLASFFIPSTAVSSTGSSNTEKVRQAAVPGASTPAPNTTAPLTTPPAQDTTKK
ncbi:MAG: preprotein translocase subunit SecG [Chitinophagaceae bacterium]